MKKIKITTYKELKLYCKKFLSRELNDNILLCGRGGLSKTRTIRNHEVPTLFFNGHTTPLNAYIQAYHAAENNIVWDDIDDIFHNKTMVKLLKQFCELSNNKKIQYGTTSKIDVPKEFAHKGNNIIILNSLRNPNAILKALFSRFLVLEFCPSNEEIFKYLSTYAVDKEILKEIKSALSYITNFNLRMYEHMVRLKGAKMDWQSYLVDQCTSGEKIKTFKWLMKQYKTDKERLRYYNGGRTQFYYWKKKLKDVL